MEENDERGSELLIKFEVYSYLSRRRAFISRRSIAPARVYGWTDA